MRSRFLGISPSAATADDGGVDRDTVFEWLDLVFGEVWQIHDAEHFEMALSVNADDSGPAMAAEAIDGLGRRLGLEFIVAAGNGLRLGRRRAQVPDLTTAMHLVALVCQSFGVPVSIRSNARVASAVSEWAKENASRIATAIGLDTSFVRHGACHVDGVEHLVLQLQDAEGRQAHVLFSCGTAATVLGDERVGVPTLGEALHLAAALLAELREAGLPR